MIDDSALSREAVKVTLSSLDGVEIIAEAENGEEGINRTILYRPDLIIMDVEMPVMDGLTALREMRARGINAPVLMLSVLTQKGASITWQALESGALDFIPKASVSARFSVQEMERSLLTKVEEFQQTRVPVLRTMRPRRPEGAGKSSGATKAPLQVPDDCKLLLIGCSTGGPRALQTIFEQLPSFPLPVVVVQHMPPVFTAAFAERLNGLSALSVKEAADGDLLEPGHAYIAPGDQHVFIENESEQARVRLDGGARVNSHRPSIDVTLRSAVSAFDGRLCAIIMTGMGRDGADGMKMVHDAGGLTLAQDEASSVIFGMNRRAIEMDAVDRVVPLGEITTQLRSLFRL